jgi:hypothetical protein
MMDLERPPNAEGESNIDHRQSNSIEIRDHVEERPFRAEYVQ